MKMLMLLSFATEVINNSCGRGDVIIRTGSALLSTWEHRRLQGEMRPLRLNLPAGIGARPAPQACVGA